MWHRNTCHHNSKRTHHTGISSAPSNQCNIFLAQRKCCLGWGYTSHKVLYPRHSQSCKCLSWRTCPSRCCYGMFPLHYFCHRSDLPSTDLSCWSQKAFRENLLLHNLLAARLSVARQTNWDCAATSMRAYRQHGGSPWMYQSTPCNPNHCQ